MCYDMTPMEGRGATKKGKGLWPTVVSLDRLVDRMCSQKLTNNSFELAPLTSNGGCLSP